MTYTVHVVLKVDPERSEPLARRRRRALADDLLEELTAWSPADLERTFRAWHLGALSLIHLLVLIVLEAEGPLAMSQLAELLDVADASATGIVDRMERRGLVQRQHALDDRRLVMVHATDAGRAVLGTLQAGRRDHLARRLERLTDDELAGFLTGLRAMRAARADP